MSLVDVVFSRKQIAAARTHVLERVEAARVARIRKYELEAAVREAARQLEEATEETQRLEDEARALRQEAEGLGLTESQIWTELSIADLEAIRGAPGQGP